MSTAAAKSEKLAIKLTADAPRKMKSRVAEGLGCDAIAVVMKVPKTMLLVAWQV